MGLLENTVLKRLFRSRPFVVKIVLKTALYAIAVFLSLVILTIPTNSISMDLPVFHPDVLQSVMDFVTDFVFLSVMIFMAVFIFMSLFINELMQNLGTNVVLNFFTGRYHTAREENRVFMFLDMRSSITIAEQLGHSRYYELLNAYYEDMTGPILETKGEVYQYVGDEIVVSWKDGRGLEDTNCLRCFELIEAAIGKNKSQYENKFGLCPGFKAGFHYGRVTTGEVGVVKKELLFTGDAINATARIQGLCNELEVNLLLSEDLLEKLPNKNQYTFKLIGERALRGRDQSITLYTI